MITDVYLFSSLLMELISSFYALPFITLIVIIVKAVLTSMKRDTVSCAICSALNLSAFAMAFAFKIIDYNTAAAFIIAFMIYGLRIKQCVLEKKINSLYGYPTLLLAAAEHTPYVLTEQLSAIAAKNYRAGTIGKMASDPILTNNPASLKTSDAGFALSIRISARSITPDHFPKSSRHCPLVGGIKIVNFL